jgi:hypothetical protein
MEERTVDAITLNSNNIQGGYHFLSLATYKCITGRKWTELPIPKGVIQQIEDRAQKELQLKQDQQIQEALNF